MDVLWVAVVIVMFALTLGLIALCDPRHRREP
jgi:hypothetical protein